MGHVQRRLSFVIFCFDLVFECVRFVCQMPCGECGLKERIWSHVAGISVQPGKHLKRGVTFDRHIAEEEEENF